MAPQQKQAVWLFLVLIFYPLQPLLHQRLGSTIACFYLYVFPTTLTSLTILYCNYEKLSIIKVLFNLTLLLNEITASVKQYNLRGNHFHDNPQVKMPIRMGYFHEIINHSTLKLLPIFFDIASVAATRSWCFCLSGKAFFIKHLKCHIQHSTSLWELRDII